MEASCGPERVPNAPRTVHGSCLGCCEAFARSAAVMVWRSRFSSTMRQQLCEPPALVMSPRGPMSPRSPACLALRQVNMCARKPELDMPLLEKREALSFLQHAKYVEDVCLGSSNHVVCVSRLGCRLRLRRARNAARCLLVVLKSWHPFAALRMVRHIAVASLEGLWLRVLRPRRP